MVGENDLFTVHPELRSWWSPSNTTSPEHLLSSSKKVVIWECSYGHVRHAAVSDVTRAHITCPTCTNRNVIKDVNSLCATHPFVAAMWCASNTGSPAEVSCGSTRIAEWVCTKGHVFRREVRLMVRSQHCVECHARLVSSNPHAMSMWVSPLDPLTITTRYRGGIPLRCQDGHNFIAKPTQAIRLRGCPVCSGRLLMAEYNSVAAAAPHLVSEWSPLNPLRATEVSRGSSEKVRWCGACTHEWEASPKARIQQRQGCPVCAGNSVRAGINDLKHLRPDIAAEWYDERRSPEDVTCGSRYRARWRCAEGHVWMTAVHNRTGPGNTGCPSCTRTSAVEEEVREYVVSIIPHDVESMTRTVISPKELDIYIPALRVGVEVNGGWWHSEAAGKERNYHSGKLSACREARVSLIQIWEDDWLLKRSVVEKMLRSKLGVNTDPRVGAREASVCTVPQVEAKGFMERNHMRGHTNGTFYDGLIAPDGNLCAVLITTQTGPTYRIDRYATDRAVVGGFGKLLEVLKRRVSENGGGTIVTFSDNEVSDGHLYARTGFALDGELPPDYSYLVDGRRTHKFNYRLSRFRTDPALVYREGMSEAQLAELNHLPRVWDSGKRRWKLHVQDAMPH